MHHQHAAQTHALEHSTSRPNRPDERWRIWDEMCRSGNAPWVRRMAASSQPSVLSSAMVFDPTNDPALAEAYAIYDGGGLRRAELEARILANQPVAKIAGSMQLAEAVIEVYEEIFFQVRAYLDDRQWISKTVFTIDLTVATLAEQLENDWRSFAYYNGIEALEELVGGAARDALQQHGTMAYLMPETRLSHAVLAEVVEVLLPADLTRAETLEVGRLGRLLDVVDKAVPMPKSLAQSFGIARGVVLAKEAGRTLYLERVRQLIAAL